MLFRLIAVGLTVAGSLTLATPSATAQEKPWPTFRRGDGYTYYRKSQSPEPRRGFEGFAGPPLRSSYCSYRRIPNRVCDRGGCRVKSWTLEQYCY